MSALEPVAWMDGDRCAWQDDDRGALRSVWGDRTSRTEAEADYGPLRPLYALTPEQVAVLEGSPRDEYGIRPETAPGGPTLPADGLEGPVGHPETDAR